MTVAGNGKAGKRVYVETYGCQMNVYDSRAIEQLMADDGYEQVNRPDQADVMLLNTCAVRDNAETRVLGRIGQLQSHKRDREVILGIVGCMAQRLGDQLAAQKKAVDLVVGTDNYRQIPGMIAQARAGAPVQVQTQADGVTTYDVAPERDPLNNSHFISITRGCDYRCTFCVVPATRGILRAKDPRQVVREAEQVARSGGVEVTLLGQNVTAYRHPDASFAQLLTDVANVSGIRRVRFLTSHPTDFPTETLQAIADNVEVCPWLHMPVQSGSDRVLRRMKRGYRRAAYMELVHQARRMLPDVTFSTDMIVGFPGETEDDFEQTLDLMREVEFDSAFTFKYSPRPQTPADRLEDDVSEEAKGERLQRLLRVQDEVWQKKSQSLLGARCEVAIEAEDHKGLGYMKGRTRNNRKVLVPRSEKLNTGDEVLVRLTGVQATTFYAEPVGMLWKYEHVGG